MERTQEEVIKIFEEKQASAEMAYKRAVHNKDVTDKICNKAYMEAYEDCIALLRGCTIVEEHPNQDLSKMYGRLPISEEITSAQFEACNQPFETIKVRVLKDKE